VADRKMSLRKIIENRSKGDSSPPGVLELEGVTKGKRELEIGIRGERSKKKEKRSTPIAPCHSQDREKVQKGKRKTGVGAEIRISHRKEKTTEISRWEILPRRGPNPPSVITRKNTEMNDG